MGLDLSKAIVNNNDLEKVTKAELENLKYDVNADGENQKNILANSKEVDDLVSSIDLSDINSLIKFGEDVTSELSKVTDTVMTKADVYLYDKTDSLLTSLQKIMDKIDLNELKKEPGVIDKIFNTVRSRLDTLLNKYNKVGKEIDNIYVKLKINENDILESNNILKEMFDNNVNHYHRLIKYILAGEQACKELENQIEKRENDLEETKDNSIQFELSNLRQALNTLEQRTQDLRVAENVALQSLPMLNTMAYTNINLVRKINSEFIITLPLFKQAIAEAVLLKKQKLQSEMLEKLDEKTNKMLLDNAKNTVELSKKAAELASTSSIKIETLQETWKTIMKGIEETKKIKEEAIIKCKEDAKKLEVIKKEFNEKFATDNNQN